MRQRQRVGGRRSEPPSLKRKRDVDDEDSDDNSNSSDSSEAAYAPHTHAKCSRRSNGKDSPARRSRKTKSKCVRSTQKTSLALGASVTKTVVQDSDGNLIGFAVQGELTLAGRVEFDERYRRNIIYKRNMFHITNGYYRIKAAPQTADGYLYVDGKRVSSLGLAVSGRLTNDNGREVELEQFTSAKRNEKRVPPRRPMPPHMPKENDENFNAVKAHGASRYSGSTGVPTSDATSTCEWMRMSFKFGTSHNGDRRSTQTYYCVVLSLMAKLENKDVTVATCSSPQYIVIARSPCGIKKGPTQTQKASAPRSLFPHQPDKQPRRGALKTIPKSEPVEEGPAELSTPPPPPPPPPTPSQTEAPEIESEELAETRVVGEKNARIPATMSQNAEEMDTETEIALFNSSTTTPPSSECASEESQGASESLAQNSSGHTHARFDPVPGGMDGLSEDPSMTDGRTRTITSCQTPIKLEFDAFAYDEGFENSVDDGPLDQMPRDHSEELDQKGVDLRAKIGSSAKQKPSYTFSMTESRLAAVRSTFTDFGPLVIRSRGASVHDAVHGGHPPPKSGFEFAAINSDDWAPLYTDIDRHLYRVEV